MQKLLSLLPKPSRYLGIEEGSVHKDLSQISLHIGLAFPDLYEVAMSYLGQKILYALLNAQETWFAERVFTPCRDACSVLQKQEQSLCTLESDTPLYKLDILGFSITHELCFTNILLMLDLGKIPLYHKDRSEDLSQCPLIIAGGGCAISSEPLAPFIDLFILGEGEEILPTVFKEFEQAKKNNYSRTTFLKQAAAIQGVYVPSLFTEQENSATGCSKLRPLTPNIPLPQRQISKNLDHSPYPIQQVIPFGAVHNRLTLEIARGCTRGCRFCQAGILYRPARERSVDNLLNILQQGLSRTGYEDISFLALSTGDFSGLRTLFEQCFDICSQEQISISLPSLRVGSIDDSIMDKISNLRRTGATLAPEAGSQRLRNIINKGVSEEELLLHVRKLFQYGWQQIKLYFMIGLPSEEQDDIQAIVDLCCKVRDAAGKGVRRLQVTAAISPFVPKPYTPFQWEAQITLQEIEEKIAFLRSAFKQEKCLKLRWHEPKMSFLEGILARGDRRLAPVLESAYKQGAVFCSWVEGFSLQPWLIALKEHNLDPMEYTGKREQANPLPWDHLNSGISKDFLLREKSLAQMGRLTPDCRYAKCHNCGVCNKENNIENKLNFKDRDQKSHDLLFDTQGKLIQLKNENEPPNLPKELGLKVNSYRIWYTKEGKAVFLSQLDLQTIFDRAFRRANLPLSFSMGFHPQPLLTFNRALPVGVSSLKEWLVITLRQNYNAENLLQSIKKFFPKGISIFAVEQIPVQKHLPQAIEEIYQLKFIGETEEQQIFFAAWHSFKQKKQVLWIKQSKKKRTELDLKKFFKDIKTDEQNNNIVLTLSWQEDYLSPLNLCLAVTPNFKLQDIHLKKLNQIFT